MAFTDTALNAASDAIKALVTHISLHTADPGLTGTGEASGISVRKAVTWGASTSGDTNGSQVTWTAGTDLTAGGVYTHVGYWNALTVGTFLGGNALSASKTPASGDQVKVTPTIDVD